MKREMIITVAGTASRFNKDLDKETLKCLYYEDSANNCLLYQIINNSGDYDKFVIVGGYLFDELENYTSTILSEIQNKIKLVYNPYYKEYGSGYSLLLGVNALDKDTDEVTFVEGDLYFDRESFNKVFTSTKSVVTVNNDFILSNKSVALYINTHNRLKYIYDTAHQDLFINEPFKAIYNSGQIWKFSDVKLLHHVVDLLSEQQKKDTNLVVIQGYFDALIEAFDIIGINIWYNCNTVLDYKNVLKIIQNEND